MDQGEDPLNPPCLGGGLVHPTLAENLAWTYFFPLSRGIRGGLFLIKERVQVGLT